MNISGLTVIKTLLAFQETAGRALITTNAPSKRITVLLRKKMLSVPTLSALTTVPVDQVMKALTMAAFIDVVIWPVMESRVSIMSHAVPGGILLIW